MLPTTYISDISQAVTILIDALAMQGIDGSTATAAQLVTAQTMGGAALNKDIEALLDKILIAIRRNMPTGSTAEINKYISDELFDKNSKGHIKLPAPKKTKAVVVKYDPGTYVTALEDFCFLQSVYDLLSGKLNRLDPVIGDQGCQWRVPFVLDAQENLISSLCSFYNCSLQDWPVRLADILGDYEVNVLKLIGAPEFAPFLNFEIFCTDYEAETSLITTDINADSQWQRSDKSTRGTRPQRISKFASKDHYLEACEVSLKQLMGTITKEAPLFIEIVNFSSNFFTSWKKDVFTISAKEYLTCCKLLTLRVKRRVDCFGLSSVPVEIKLPLDERIVVNKYKNLAACSWEYMDDIALTMCEISGNKVTWKSRGQDQWEYTYEGDNSNLCVSLHKCLQTGYQTTQAGAAYWSHLFFGPLRLIFMYQHAKNQPIIIDHRRLKCTVLPNTLTHVDPDGKKPNEIFNDAEYNLIGSEIMYFEPDAFGGFSYVPNPTFEQQRKVGMCVETYSIITEGDVTVYANEDMAFKSMDWNVYSTALKKAPIVNLIMMAAVFHPELPGNVLVQGNRTSNSSVTSIAAEGVYKTSTLVSCTGNPQNYLMTMSGPQVPLGGGNSTAIWDIWTEKTCCSQLMTNLKATDTEYRHVLPGRTTGQRITSTIPFGAIHIYGCTFAVKVMEMQAMLDDLQQKQRRESGVHRLMTQDLDTDRPK